MKQSRNCLIAFSIILIFSSLAYGQSNFKASISMGSVMPIGEFKSTDNSDLNAGFSKSGFTLNFDGDYYLSHRVAVSARFHFSLSSLNDPEVSKWLKNQAGEYFLEDSMATKSVGYWQWSAPLIGVKYNYPIIINKLYFEAGFFSGLSITPVPTQSLQIDDTANERVIYSENIVKTSYAVPIMIDAGLRIRFNESIAIKLQSSYFQSKASYKHSNYIVNAIATLQPEAISTTDIKVPLKALSFSVGLVYSL